VEYAVTDPLLFVILFPPSYGLAYEASDSSGLLSPELAAGIRRIKGAKKLGVRLGNWLTSDQAPLWQLPDPETLKGARDRATTLLGLRSAPPRARRSGRCSPTAPRRPRVHRGPARQRGGHQLPFASCAPGLSLGLRRSLRLPDNGFGTLALYSGETSFFDEEEVRLLEDVASDISYACGALSREQQRKRAEHVLLETHRHLETLFEASPVAMIALDQDGMGTAWNHTAEEVFGWSRDEVIGSPLPTVPESCTDDFVRLRDHILRGKGYSALEAKRKKKSAANTL
jgi:PAS domain-containing protein